MASTVDWVLRNEPIGDFRYPQLFVSYLHDWLREWAIDVRIVKPIRNGEDPDDVRFKTLLDHLASSVPFAPLSIVQEAGSVEPMSLVALPGRRT